nr:MAG TPA: hypothetical protein [Caudoviricetes sp.]
MFSPSVSISAMAAISFLSCSNSIGMGFGAVLRALCWVTFFGRLSFIAIPSFASVYPPFGRLCSFRQRFTLLF